MASRFQTREGEGVGRVSFSYTAYREKGLWMGHPKLTPLNTATENLESSVSSTNGAWNADLGNIESGAL